MKAEILIGLTTADGVPLDSHRGSPLENAEHTRWFRPGHGDCNGSVRWSSNKPTRSSKKPEWTHAEAAMACKDLDERYYLALLFSFARDDSALWDLRRHMLAFAESRQRIERWPKTVRTLSGEEKPYLTRLVDVSLMEERSPSRFIRGEPRATGRPANIRPILLDVNRDIWRRKLQGPYEALIQEYQIWLGIGAAHMGRRLREEK